MSETVQFPPQPRSVPLSGDILAVAAMIKLQQAQLNESASYKHLMRRDALELLNMAFDLEAIGGTVDALYLPENTPEKPDCA